MTDTYKLDCLVEAVDRETGINLVGLRGRSRLRPLVVARELFCHIAHKVLDISLERVSERIDRTKANVSYLCRACENDAAIDHEFAKVYGKIEEVFWQVMNAPVRVSGDPVNHPAHYTWLKAKCGIEVIDITRHLDFPKGNAVKYILRSGYKSKETEIEDLEKAIWYLRDKIEELKRADR